MLTGNSKQSIEPGQVITIIFMTFMTVTTLTGSTMLMKDIIEARNHAINLYYFIDHQNIIADKTESSEPIIDSIEIQVTNLDFKQDLNEDKKILDGVDLEFAAHKITSIVGESGSGKSTLIKILSRFQEPLSGEVKWNNCDIKDIKLKYLRDHIGYVNQDAVFFDFSLRDNMKLSNNDATDAEIISIINSVNMQSWFDKLEDGLDTRLGNQGNTLSGGEKQRLSIGRALLKPKLKLLLLDEATAALDYKTEKIV